MNKVLLGWVILLTATSSGWAANGSGTLDISVRDLNGKPIAEATVYAIYSGRVGSRFPRFRADSAGRLVMPGLLPGSYEIHAYKETEGYPDTFFAFYPTSNKKAWQVVNVIADRTTRVILELGPKYAKLKLTVKNEQGDWVRASVNFKRPDQPYPLTTGAGELLVPPIPFRFEIVANGYQVWKSKLLNPRPNEALEVTVRLIRLPNQEAKRF